MFERPDFGPTGGVGHLDSGRFSTGVVWNIGSAALPPPVTFACTAIPQSIYPGDPLSVIGVADHVHPRKAVAYHWVLGGLAVNGSKPVVEVDTTTLEPGSFMIAGQVSEGVHAGQSAHCAARFTVMPFAAPSLTCVANRSAVSRGEKVLIQAHATSPQNRPLRYTYSTSAGPVVAQGNVAELTVTSPAAEMSVACSVADDKGNSASSTAIIVERDSSTR